MMKRGALLLCVLLVLMAPFAQAERIIAARYVEPVERYGHFALGRPHEYARLVATTDAGREAVLVLPEDEVFEDLAPRLVYLADQASPALLVIVSSRDGGSRLALVGLDGSRLEIVAQSVPIGRTNRWLNPVGVADLDGDGEAEVAAVTTPHIGGVLRVYRRRGEHLVEIASLGGFSNHVYGSRQLALSKPVQIDGRAQLLVPDGRRETIRAIRLTGAGLVETARCRPPEPVMGPGALHDCERRLNQRGPALLLCLHAPAPSDAADPSLQSLAIRARLSERTLLGEEAPENFEAYDLSANVALPWQRYAASGWGLGTRVTASAGLLRGSGKEALVVSLIPEVTLGSEDGRFTLDMGAGGALFSRHRFGSQDYGGPFQFALTLGIGVPLYSNLGIGYRFLHYSDAAVNGSDTTGADFHMIEFRYRFD